MIGGARGQPVAPDSTPRSPGPHADRWTRCVIHYSPARQPCLLNRCHVDPGCQRSLQPLANFSAARRGWLNTPPHRPPCSSGKTRYKSPEGRIRFNPHHPTPDFPAAVVCESLPRFYPFIVDRMLARMILSKSCSPKFVFITAPCRADSVGVWGGGTVV